MKLKPIFIEYMDERRLTKLSDAQVVNEFLKSKVNFGINNYSDEQRTRVKTCLNQISETSKTILQMHYWECITFKEISKILGLALETVKQLHEKAIKEIRIRYFSHNQQYKNKSVSKLMTMAQAI